MSGTSAYLHLKDAVVIECFRRCLKTLVIRIYKDAFKHLKFMGKLDKSVTVNGLTL